MDNGSALLTSPLDARWLAQAAPPPPKLLPDWESAHRVFFGNLRDAVLLRRSPRVTSGSKSGALWRDVFIPAYTPWGSLLESALWHASVLLVIIAISQGWGNQLPIER